MSLRDWRSEYLTILKLHVPNINGFDETLTGISADYLQLLVGLIINPEMYKGIFIGPYDEVADFLDGNGFKVEGNEISGYTISLLNT